MNKRRQCQYDSVSLFLLSPLARLTLEYVDERQVYAHAVHHPVHATRSHWNLVVFWTIEYRHRDDMLHKCMVHRDSLVKRFTLFDELTIWQDICNRFDVLLAECVKNGWLVETRF